jgi:hypothetical protein
VTQPQQKFEEWALLELFGHQRTVLTKYLNPSAIYAISPCDENVAVAAAQTIDAAPIKRYELKQLAAPGRFGFEEEEDD